MNTISELHLEKAENEFALAKMILENSIKLDLRVGKIIEIEEHPNADKLFVMKVDLGEGKGKERTIVAGLRGYYQKEDLKGKRAIFVANLEPAKFRGIESNGMILAAATNDRKEVVFLKPKDDAKEGTKLEFMEG